jgi:hypothetical protein
MFRLWEVIAAVALGAATGLVGLAAVVLLLVPDVGHKELLQLVHAIEDGHAGGRVDRRRDVGCNLRGHSIDVLGMDPQDDVSMQASAALHLKQHARQGLKLGLRYGWHML